jgi:hypothetical protein
MWPSRRKRLAPLAPDGDLPRHTTAIGRMARSGRWLPAKESALAPPGNVFVVAKLRLPSGCDNRPARAGADLPGDLRDVCCAGPSRFPDGQCHVIGLDRGTSHPEVRVALQPELPDAGGRVSAHTWTRSDAAPPAVVLLYSAIGVGAEYAPASRSSMRVGPAGAQPRSSRVLVLVAVRSMAKKVAIHPK